MNSDHQAISFVFEVQTAKMERWQSSGQGFTGLHITLCGAKPY